MNIAYLIFGVAEPALQILGFLTTSFAPEYYALTQTPTPVSHQLLPSEKILTFQFGNLVLVLAILGLSIMNANVDRAVVDAYLSALWWGDLGHVGVTAWCMGPRLFDVRQWTLVNRASLGVPCFLFAARSLYFLGLV